MCLSLLDRPLEENMAPEVKEIVECFKDPQLRLLERIVFALENINENLSRLNKLLERCLHE